MKTKIFLFIVLSAIVIYSNIQFRNNNRTECEQFAKEKGTTIVSIDRHYTIFGTPYYWVNKNTTIWEIKLSNDETWFMRPRFFTKNDWLKK